MDDRWAEYLYLYDTDCKWYVYFKYFKPKYNGKWNDLAWIINLIESKDEVEA